MKYFLNFFFAAFTVWIISIPKEDKPEDVFIYIERSSFIRDVNGYEAYFKIKSVDQNFSHDNYFFKINSPDLNYHSLPDLGVAISLDTINLIYPQIIYDGKSSCETHTELSMFSKNKKRINIVSQINKGEINKKYIVWKASYRGTAKDIIFTNMNGTSLLDN